jgi:hypothetical protein
MNVVPGLYLALLASLLGWALRRWWDPVPGRVWAAFALLLMALFGPALFLGRVLLPVDILPGLRTGPPQAAPEGNRLQLDLVTQIVPWQHQVRRALQSGSWPLWNDLTGAGMPLLADPQSQALQPLVLLALPLPLPQAVGMTAALRVLVALVFGFLLLRRQGLSEAAALFGSVSFALGGFLLLWLSWPLGNATALLPLVLYALVLSEARGARRDFLLLIAALAALLTGGHPETILYVAIVGGLFALARLLRPAGQPRSGLLVRWALAAGIASALAAPALVPALRFAPQTLRHHLVEQRNRGMAERSPLAGWRTSQERGNTSAGIAKRLVSVYAPNSFGNSRYEAYWGDNSTNEDAGGFVGGVALLAALLAFAPAARRFPQERLFLGLAAASLLIAVRIPGVPWALSALPVFDQSISAHRRLLLVLAFSLAYLAACWVERWRTREGAKPGRIAAVAAMLLGLVAAGYLVHPETIYPTHWIWMAVQLAAVTGAGVILLTVGSAREPLDRDRRIWLLTAVAAVELLIIHGPANPSVRADGYYPTTPAIEFLQTQSRDFRVAGVGDRLLANSPSVYGLADVRVSNPIAPYPYLQALAPVSASVLATEQLLVKPEHPLYQLLGVRHVIAPPKLRSQPGLRAVFREPEARIFERESALPRLFLPDAAESEGALAWPDWLAANRDFAARALVSSVPGGQPSWTAARPAESAVDILNIESTRLTARAVLVEERLLASSIYQDGGWTVLAGGRRQLSTTTDGPFAGAWLPAGEHRLELLYRAPGFLTGMALAAVAFAALLAWMVRPPA